MPAAPLPKTSRHETLGVIALASAVLLLVAVRASIGLSFYDDSYYVVVPLRFAHGARLFIDELSLQSLGELFSVPFVKLYVSFFGTTGLALFVRELYVALAAVVGLALYRLLRPSARPAAAAFAIILPMLALPYHLIAPTYNTVAQLCFMLSVVLAWASVRDRRTGLAGASGVFLALGSVAYPPLAIAAIVLLATYTLVARRRQLITAAVGGAALTGALVACLMVVGVTADDLHRTVAFATSNVGKIGSPVDKLRWTLGQPVRALVAPWLWPMWGLAAVASLRPLPKRLRAAALAAIPLAAALPGALLLARGDGFAFGSATSSWMITLTAGIALPVTLWARRKRRKDYLRLLALAAPFALTGFVTVAYVSNSSWNRGAGSIVLAPLTLGLLLCWASAIAEEWGDGPAWGAILVTLLVALGLLFANVFDDPVSFSSHELVTRGPWAGVTTSTQRAGEMRDLSAFARREVSPQTRVAFLGEREAYLLVGGVWNTPAAWLPPAPSDRAAIDYYERQGRAPSVFFVDELAIAREGGYSGGAAADPLLQYVLSNYRKSGTVADFGVFVRK